MAENSKNMGIVNSWSLISFARSHGEMRLAPFVNKQTKESFTSCAFIDKGNITLVGFSSSLGELTTAQIKSMKDDLQVVELTSGSYKLCKKGTDSWEVVDLGL